MTVLNLDQMVDRFLYPSGSNPPINSNGLLQNFSDDSRKYTDLINLNEISELSGGVLLAEGGMGKSTLMRQLKNIFPDEVSYLVELSFFSGDPAGLRDEITSFWRKKNESLPDTPAAIIIDGLDEATDLANVIVRQIRLFPEGTKVWIASRDVMAIRAIQSACPHLSTYSLAPLSLSNIIAIAKCHDVDGDLFTAAMYQVGIVELCTKPIGCELALSVFKVNGLEEIGQSDLWGLGVERLCDETPSPSRWLASLSSFSLDDVVACASWIALCLTLTNRTAVWICEESHCPENCLSLSDVILEGFPVELVRATLERGVFTTRGDGRIPFAHGTYRDYLSSRGFTQFIPADHWSALLLNQDRTSVPPPRVGIATWLAAANYGFLQELSGIQSEILLSSSDAVQAVGKAELCSSLISRSEEISYRQRRDNYADHLFRLAGQETTLVLQEKLLDENSSAAEIEFAIEIAVACSCVDLSNILADRVLDSALSLSQRVDASYAVYRLDDENAKSRLKEALPIRLSDDPRDDLRGNILRCCWPHSLSISELTGTLVAPQKGNYFGPYSHFLGHDLVGSLSSVLEAGNARVLLEWCLEFLLASNRFGSLRNLSNCVYTYCWRWALNPEICTLLALGYRITMKEHVTPFAEDRYTTSQNNIIISQDEFTNDVTSRFAVLEALLQEGGNNRLISRIPYQEYPLYGADDIDLLFSKALDNSEPTHLESWITCIKAVIWRVDHDLFSKQIDALHQLRPDLIDSTQQIKLLVEESAVKARKRDAEWKSRDAEYEAKQTEKQEQIDQEIRTTLSQPDIAPNSFPGIAAWLNSENGRCEFGSIDLTQSPGWKKLDSEGKDVLIDLAWRYLREGTVEPTAPNRTINSVAEAFTLLFYLRPNLYRDLPTSVWDKCSVELLKVAFISESVEILTPIFDTLQLNFPEVAEVALTRVVTQEVSRGHIHILHFWKERLSEESAQLILEIALDFELGSEKGYFILSELESCGYGGLILSSLDSFIGSMWNPTPDVQLNKYVLLSLKLNPIVYGPKIIKTLQVDSSWGSQWIEGISNSHDSVSQALWICGPDIMADFYIWLHGVYPSSTRPEYDTAYTPQALDNIHDLQNQLLKVLVDGGSDGTTEAMGNIYAAFPQEEWLKNAIKDARGNEQAAKVPALKIGEIRALRDRHSSGCRLVSTVGDLHDLVMEKLHDYQVNLQGDIPAIGDLWDSADTVKPRGEEYFSDHLARYLNLTLSSGVIINREVQIRRKLYSDGQSGSRTDLWIQAIDGNGQVLTLCIEVKCNWNSSAKGALRAQLINKYMTGGTAEAGILLLGWYECPAWEKSRQRSTVNWTDIESAKNDLDAQAEQERSEGCLVSTLIIDCSLK